MEASEVIDITAIITGLFGAFLNAILFWIVTKNQSIDKKCTNVYQNLAAIDIFNCLVIPICYLTAKGHGYSIDVEHPRNGMMYLLFGCTINIPYLMLILLSVARIFMFKFPMVYMNKINLIHFKIACAACWIISIGSGTGIWLCYLLSGYAKVEILIDLLKFESIVTKILVIATIAFFATILIFLQKKIVTVSKDHVGSVTADMEETYLIKAPPHTILKDLSSAKITFSYFLVSVTVWSAFPFAFSLTFVLCGPYYNTTTAFCNHIKGMAGFSDPKLSYAIMLLSLCGMSIVNSIILMRQKSFLNILKITWIQMSFRNVNEENDVQENVPRDIDIPNSSTSSGNVAETMKSNQD